jgi:hypothetical protein
MTEAIIAGRNESQSGEPMDDSYDPAADSRKSYAAAIEALRERHLERANTSELNQTRRASHTCRALNQEKRASHWL